MEASIVVRMEEEHHAIFRSSATDDDNDCGGSAVLTRSSSETQRRRRRTLESLPSMNSSDVSDTEESSSSSDLEFESEEPQVDEVVGNSSRDDDSSVVAPVVVPVPPREPLSFSFVGYSVWLHLSQTENDNDLDRALHSAADRYGILPIPAPHVTVIYGMTHLSEDEARRKFLDGGEVQDAVRRWPKLRSKGLLFDRCYDGVDGESMDMAWMEIMLSTSPAHEECVDAVHDIFHHSDSNSGDHHRGANNNSQSVADADSAHLPPRARPWSPHLSLAYDNPDEDSPLSLGAAARLTAEIPTLLTDDERDVVAVSLWKTQGRMAEWIELERIELNGNA